MKIHEKELLISHLFDAPVDVVFDAWTNPEILRQWYAPDGCTIEFKSIEVIQGGQFHYYISHPVHGGGWVKGKYVEISAPKRLVFTIAVSNEQGGAPELAADGKAVGWPGEILTTVTFEQFGNRTKVTIHEAVSEQKAKQTGAYKGWLEMFDKLNRLFLNY